MPLPPRQLTQCSPEIRSLCCRLSLYPRQLLPMILKQYKCGQKKKIFHFVRLLVVLDIVAFILDNIKSNSQIMRLGRIECEQLLFLPFL